MQVRRDHEYTKQDELWQGEAFDPYQPDGDHVAVYLRVGKAHSIVAELLCTVIARTLGLPAPEPFVIVVEPGMLPGSTCIAPATRQICVGTRDIGGQTFAQLIRADAPTAAKLLSSWEHLMPVTALDEWLANPDRNMGNLLYVAQTIHIIDHADAFGGSARQLFPLASLTTESLTNVLGKILAADNDDRRQTHLANAAQWLTSTAAALNIPAAVAMADITRWQTTEEEAELVHFITDRLLITHQLLCSRLGFPQLGLTA